MVLGDKRVAAESTSERTAESHHAMWSGRIGAGLVGEVARRGDCKGVSWITFNGEGLGQHQVPCLLYVRVVAANRQMCLSTAILVRPGAHPPSSVEMGAALNRGEGEMPARNFFF